MMRPLDELLIAHIGAWWRDTDKPDFEEQINSTYADYLAAGGNDEHYNERWTALREVFAKRLRKDIRKERGTGWWYINGSMLYFEAGEQCCPECKAPHNNLFARCAPCQDMKNYRDALFWTAKARVEAGR